MRRTTVYLVRHAHAFWSPDEARPLSAAGSRDALMVATLLSDRPVAAVHSSPSRRALDTVAPLAARLGLRTADVHDLRERELPAVDDFALAAAASWSHPDIPVMPGAESNADAAARGLSVLQSLRLQHAGQEMVISTHGTLLALMLNGLDSRYGFDFWQRLSFPDVYQLDFSADRLDQVVRLWR